MGTAISPCQGPTVDGRHILSSSPACSTQNATPAGLPTFLLIAYHDLVIIMHTIDLFPPPCIYHAFITQNYPNHSTPCTCCLMAEFESSCTLPPPKYLLLIDYIYYIYFSLIRRQLQYY